MPYNIRIVSTYPPRTCGIGTFSRDLANALEHFTGEVGNVRIAAIDIGRHARGILVDPGEPSVEQIAQALDCLNFDKGKRLRMEKEAHRRGAQMKWHNTAWTLLQYIELVEEEKEMLTGRDMIFKREKPSVFQNGGHRSIALIQSKPAPLQYKALLDPSDCRALSKQECFNEVYKEIPV